MEKNKTICVIDDEDIIQFIVKTIIENINSDIKILAFKNGEEGIESLKALLASNNDMPDIILLDINMPVMNGWQFLDEFVKIKSQIAKKISIYILSSSTAQEDKGKASAYKDISGYLNKPIQAETLRKIALQDYDN